MKIVIAPDSYKECLSSRGVAAAMADAVLQACPSAEVVQIPLADGPAWQPRARGRKGGRPKTDPKVVEKTIKLYESKTMSVSEILEITGIKKTTLYDYIKKKN